MSKRYFFHPIFTNARSRIIFLWFLFIGASFGGVFWWQARGIMKAANVPPTSLFGQNGFEAFLFHPAGFWFLVILAAALAAGYTSHRVLGPIQRIEEWLMAIKSGLPAQEFRMRKGDKLEMFVTLSEEILARLRRDQNK